MFTETSRILKTASIQHALAAKDVFTDSPVML